MQLTIDMARVWETAYAIAHADLIGADSRAQRVLVARDRADRAVADLRESLGLAATTQAVVDVPVPA